MTLADRIPDVAAPRMPVHADTTAVLGARSRRSIRRTPAGLAALSATSHPVLITDTTQPDNPIVYVNSAFRRLTRYRDAEILGQNCRFLQGADTEPAIIAELRAAVSSGQGIQRDILNYRKDGTAFWNRACCPSPQSRLAHPIQFRYYRRRPPSTARASHAR